MIDEDHLRSLRLFSVPYYQKVIGYGLIMPNYELPPKTEIIIEGYELIPDDRPVVFAINHTDRFNYFPFQYKLWRTGFPRYTSTWVKGKYYENPILGWVLDRTNNIPLPSRGYIIVKDFISVHDRKPDDDEYRLLRDCVDGEISQNEVEKTFDLRQVTRASLRDFAGGASSYRNHIWNKNNSMMEIVEERTLETLFEKNNNLIVFPEGTRSVQLGELKPGLAQFALKHELTVVPVGCNGSDKVYPGNLPLARGGTVTYRVGEPMTMEDSFADLQVPGDYQPFSRDALRYEDTFREATSRIADRLNSLLDNRHQRQETAESRTSPDQLA